MSMPFYVAPEQVMKDRADYARKGIARGRSLAARGLRRRHPDLRREPVEHPAQGQRDLRPHRLRRRRQVQRVRPAPHRRRAPRRPQGLLVQPRGRRRPQPRQPVRPDPRPGLHPRDEADGGRDPRRRDRRTTPAHDQLFHILYDGTVDRRGSASPCSAARPRRSRTGCECYADGLDLAGRCGAVGALAARPELTADDLEVAVLERGDDSAHVPTDRGRRARRRSCSPTGPDRTRHQPSLEPATARPCGQAGGESTRSVDLVDEQQLDGLVEADGASTHDADRAGTASRPPQRTGCRRPERARQQPRLEAVGEWDEWATTPTTGERVRRAGGGRSVTGAAGIGHGAHDRLRRVRLRCVPDGAAHLRPRERVRRHLHAPRPAAAEPRRGGPLPVPPGGVVGSQQQRVPRQRCPPVPRRRLAPRVRHARVRLDLRPRRARQGGRADPRAAARPAPSSGSARRASAATSTCSRTTPTRPATATAATRTTCTSRRDDFAHYAEVLIPFLVSRQIYAGAGKVLQTARGAMFCISQRAEHIWEGVSSRHHPLAVPSSTPATSPTPTPSATGAST